MFSSVVLSVSCDIFLPDATLITYILNYWGGTGTYCQACVKVGTCSLKSSVSRIWCSFNLLGSPWQLVLNVQSFQEEALNFKSASLSLALFNNIIPLECCIVSWGTVSYANLLSVCNAADKKTDVATTTLQPIWHHCYYIALMVLKSTCSIE